MTIDDPTQRPVRVLARRLRKGDLTAAEALEAQLDRIAQRNPVLNAVVSLDADGARDRAARPMRRDAEARSGGRCMACR